MGRPVGSGTRPLAERLAEKVSIDDDTGCHVWTGALDPQGYGRIFVSGRGNGLAYVQAFLLAGGTIPVGYTLDHLCRNRRCVNPAHLEPVTRGDNVLRGEGITAVNARKTHCKRGHEFTPDNTYRTGKGGRGCRTCKREYQRDRQRRLRLANAPLAILATLMLVVSLVGCTPEQVMQAAGHLGVNLTAEQATAVADAHTAKHGPTDPTVEVTPEMAKAIAWTAAVHEAEQQTPGNRIRARWAGTGQQETAVRVAACESGGRKESGIDPGSQNPYSSAFGVFQFLDKTWIGTGIAKTRDLGLQIEAAYRLWKARGWSPWNASRHCWAR